MNATIKHMALCKQHIIDLGCNPNTDPLPTQGKCICEIEGCDNSAEVIAEVRA